MRKTCCSKPASNQLYRWCFQYAVAIQKRPLLVSERVFYTKSGRSRCFSPQVRVHRKSWARGQNDWAAAALSDTYGTNNITIYWIRRECRHHISQRVDRPASPRVINYTTLWCVYTFVCGYRHSHTLITCNNEIFSNKYHVSQERTERFPLAWWLLNLIYRRAIVEGALALFLSHISHFTWAQGQQVRQILVEAKGFYFLKW